MKNVSRHHGTLRVLGRLPSSRNGNPRYRVAILDHADTGPSCVTAVDCSLGYTVQNLDGRQVIATIGTHYGRATLDSVTAK